LIQSSSFYKHFSRCLLSWYSANPRPLPWKKTNNPHFIWLSEIILQQTRVEQGLPYYLHFIKKFPTIKKLAEADEEEVLKCWQGLGYYSRARNLHFAAKQIMDDFGGKFPHTYAGILSLKGIGEYTAAAIASFAFNLPHAVVDGNVVRVLSRVFGVKESFHSTNGKKRFFQLANSLLDLKQPGAFNQALMNFGAMVCLPQNPKCASCIFKK
jgi:A/G-specific adenine glycosylase